MLKVILVAVISVTACVAQERCCVPESHTIREVRTVERVENGRPVSDIKLSHWAVDFNEERFAEEGEVLNADGTTQRFRVIELLKEEARYFIENEKCTKEKPKVERADRCVSENATFASSNFVGDHQLEMESWTENIRDETTEGVVYRAFTRGNCIPTSIVFFGTVKRDGETHRETSNSFFTEFRKGVEDPDRWFTPPSSCP